MKFRNIAGRGIFGELKVKGKLPMTGKYMAYVGSYSYTGKAKGITVYDVDVETGKFIYRCEVEVDNSSYLKASQNGQILYSIADEGVVAFRVLPNGSLARLNSANIRGMRGCHLSTSKADDYIFISGFHDGKITVLNLNKDGSVGQIADGVFRRLKAPTALREQAVLLIGQHMALLTPDKKLLRRRISRLGWDTLDKLLLLQEADMGGKGTGEAEELDVFPKIRAVLAEIRAENACLTVKDLAVNGNDLLALGYQGKAIGETLNALLEGVLDEALPNERQALLDRAKQRVANDGISSE